MKELTFTMEEELERDFTYIDDIINGIESGHS